MYSGEIGFTENLKKEGERIKRVLDLRDLSFRGGSFRVTKILQGIYCWKEEMRLNGF